MSELFSNTRLVDYFCIADVQFIEFDSEEDQQLTNPFQSSTPTFNKPHPIVSKRQIEVQIPDKDYKEYELNLEDIFDYVPQESAYLYKPPNNFFTMWFINIEGKYYYGHFLKVYEQKKISKINKEVYLPKYLCLFSLNCFFVSFRNILEELYQNSTVNDSKCYKIENILTLILFRTFLPKYESTQLSFCLGSRQYNFSKNPLRSEISMKLLFTMISPEDVVKLFVGLLMNSKIIIFHSNPDIFCPLVQCLMSLIFPLAFGYNIVNNLYPSKIDYLDAPSATIFGLHKQAFAEDEFYFIMDKLRSIVDDPDLYANFVICDLDKDSEAVSITYHEEMIKKELLPNISQMHSLINKLKKLVGLTDKDKEIKSAITKNSSYIWDYFSLASFGDYNETKKLKSKTVKRESSLYSSAFSKGKFKEWEIRGLFLEYILCLFLAYDEEKHYNVGNLDFELTESHKKLSTKNLNRTHTNDISAELLKQKTMSQKAMSTPRKSVKYSVITKDLDLSKANQDTQKALKSKEPSENKELKVSSKTETDKELSKMKLTKKSEDYLHKNFNTMEFIASSSSEVRAFLKNNIGNECFDWFIMNLNNVVDKRHKANLLEQGIFKEEEITMNQNIKNATLIENFEKVHYPIFMSGLEFIKRKRPVYLLLEYYANDIIYNTISVGNIQYEKLPYKQRSIFRDGVHLLSLKHKRSLNLSACEIKNTIVRLDEQNYYNKQMEHEDLVSKINIMKAQQYSSQFILSSFISKKTKPTRQRYFTDHEKKQTILHKSMTKESNIREDKDLMDNMENLSYSKLLNDKNSIFTTMKNLVNLDTKDLIYRYFSYTPVQVIISENTLFNSNNLIKTNTSLSTNKSINRKQMSSLLNFKASNKEDKVSQYSIDTNYDTQNKNMIFNKSNASGLQGGNSNSTAESLPSKENYIEKYNLYFNTHVLKSSPVIEFPYSLGINVIQTSTFCPSCSRPNSIWDIRREIYYDRESSKAKFNCRFCGKKQTPYFLVIEETKNSDNGEPIFENETAKSKHNEYFESINSSRIKDQIQISLSNIEPNTSNLSNPKKFSHMNNFERKYAMRKVEFYPLDYICYSLEYEATEPSNTQDENKPLKLIQYQTPTKMEKDRIFNFDYGNHSAKKIILNLFYNMFLLCNEFKVRVYSDSRIEILTLETYMLKVLGIDLDFSDYRNPVKQIQYNNSRDINSSSTAKLNILTSKGTGMTVSEKEKLQSKKSLVDKSGKKSVYRENYQSFLKKYFDPKKRIKKHRKSDVITKVDSQLIVKFDLKKISTREYSQFREEYESLPKEYKRNLDNLLGSSVYVANKNKQSGFADFDLTNTALKTKGKFHSKADATHDSSPDKNIELKLVNPIFNQKLKNFEIIASVRNFELDNKNLKVISTCNKADFSDLSPEVVLRKDCNKDALKSWKSNLDQYFSEVNTRGKKQSRSKSKSKEKAPEVRDPWKDKDYKNIEYSFEKEILHQHKTKANRENLLLPKNESNQILSRRDGRRKSRKSSERAKSLFNAAFQKSAFMYSLENILNNKFNSRKISDYRPITNLEELNRRLQHDKSISLNSDDDSFILGKGATGPPELTKQGKNDLKEVEKELNYFN